MGGNAYLYNPCVIFYQISLETVVSPHILTPPLSVSSMLALVPVSVASRSEKEGDSQFGFARRMTKASRRGVKINMIHF